MAFWTQTSRNAYRGVLMLHWNVWIRVWIRTFFASSSSPPLPVAPSQILATGASSRETPTTTATLAVLERFPRVDISPGGLGITKAPCVDPCGPHYTGPVLEETRGCTVKLAVTGAVQFDARWGGHPLASRAQILSRHLPNLGPVTY
ncbi:uncharacterized protein [Apostichopus japonicus]|uniref:uncharacterized protein n=1 Tax=Stichopus japonicus TaxID=307972 RepID=UPI003AB4F9D1